MDLKNYLKCYIGTPTFIHNLKEQLKAYLRMKLSLKDLDFISGAYKFTNYVTLPTGITYILSESPWYHNIIVNNGRLNILNRLMGNTYGYIQGMGIGTGSTALALSNSTLASETMREEVGASVNGSPNWNTSFTASFTASQINGSTEIGLFDNATMGSGSMLTRSTYPVISVPPGTNIGINYQLSLNTGFLSAGWVLTTGKVNTYQIPQTSSVLSVIETDTGNGYSIQTSISAVESTPNSYYYDGSANLYIHTSNSANPNTHSVMVLSNST